MITITINVPNAEVARKQMFDLLGGPVVTVEGGAVQPTARGTTAEIAAADVVPGVKDNGSAEEATASPEPKAARKPRAANTKTSADTATEQDTSTQTPTSDTADAPQENSESDPKTTADEPDTGREGPYPDFDKEVTPVVLGAVRKKGKEWVAAILQEFGVEKASQLKDEQFQELIDMINDRMGE